MTTPTKTDQWQPATDSTATLTDREGRWVMTSHVNKSPWCLTFFIGSITIAEISFSSKKPYLIMWHKQEGPFDSVSDAMRRMHQLLKSPPDTGETS